MACSCNKRNSNPDPAQPSGTYRVVVGSRKVYESASQQAAETVAKNFPTARVLSPGETL